MEEDYESLPSSSTAVNLAAGAVAGVFEHSLVYPIDSVKTRLQSLRPAADARYRGTVDALRKIIAQEGLLRVLRGMPIVVIGSAPAHALYFGTYESLKKTLTGTQFGWNSSVSHCVAGGAASLMHDCVMNPAEVVKQRMQMYNSPFQSSRACVAHIWRTEGPMAFYRSFTTQLFMNVPFQCVLFGIYERMQEILNPSRTYNPKAHMISGALAGAIAAGVTTPLDVCKTLLNTQESTTLKETKQSRIRGISQAMTTIRACCGFQGYFRGMSARMLYQMPSTAITWSTYEFCKYILHERNHVSIRSTVQLEVPKLMEPREAKSNDEGSASLSGSSLTRDVDTQSCT